MSNNQKELAPCPFCGFEQTEDSKYIVSVVGSNWFAKCPRCNIGICGERGTDHVMKLKPFDEKVDAKLAWNTRHPDPTIPVAKALTVEEIDELLHQLGVCLIAETGEGSRVEQQYIARYIHASLPPDQSALIKELVEALEEEHRCCVVHTTASAARYDAPYDHVPSTCPTCALIRRAKGLGGTV